MSISAKHFRELKTIIEKEGDREYSMAEVGKVGFQLVELAKIFLDSWQKEQGRLRKLKENPKGFVLDGVGYTCFICHRSTEAEENWYDKWGIKCSTCQDAINRKEIPPSLAKHRDSWYSKYDLESAFKLKGKVLNSWIRDGLLKPRMITNRGKGTYYTLFLIKDNKGFLPPKKLVESRMVTDIGEDGKEGCHSEPWYYFVDPWEHLEGYKIMDYMKVPDENRKKVEKKFFDSLNLNLSDKHFDSRDPLVKRKEFNSQRNKLLKQILKERHAECQLKLLDQCEGNIVLDHMVPLSSNYLNKYLHKEKAEKGKKVVTQSFGSNHPGNLLLACERCNNYKKHRFVRRDKKGKFKTLSWKDE